MLRPFQFYFTDRFTDRNAGSLAAAVQLYRRHTTVYGITYFWMELPTPWNQMSCLRRRPYNSRLRLLYYTLLHDAIRGTRRTQHTRTQCANNLSYESLSFHMHTRQLAHHSPLLQNSFVFISLSASTWPMPATRWRLESFLPHRFQNRTSSNGRT